MAIRDNVLDTVRQLVSLEGSKVAFAKKIGVSKQAVGNWMSGSNAPDIEVIGTISKVYQVPMSDILGNHVEYAVVSLNENKDDDMDGYVDVPIYGEIAAGTPIEMIEFEDEFPVPVKVKMAHPKSGLLRVKGGSWNRDIPNGYLALVDFDMTEPENDADPYAICVNGYTATIKSVERLENGLKLKPNSYDPTCVPIIYDYNKDDTEEVTIIGKVVWATMPFDYEI